MFSRILLSKPFGCWFKPSSAALVPLCSVYSGHQSILIPPSELEVNPSLWLSAVSQYKVRDTFCSYSVMELCTKSLGLQTDALKVDLRSSDATAHRRFGAEFFCSSVSRVGLVPGPDVCGGS